VKEVKFIMRMNQADNASTLRGITPKKAPPSIRYSTLPEVSASTAIYPVIREMAVTIKIVRKGLILNGTSGMAIIPDNKIVTNAFNS
jgi:hypothetical protein